MRKLSCTERMIEMGGTIENSSIKDMGRIKDFLKSEPLLSDYLHALMDEEELCLDVVFEGSFYPGDFDTRIDPGYPDYIDDFACKLYVRDHNSVVAHILTDFLTDKYIEQTKSEMIIKFISDKITEKEYFQERIGEENERL